MAKSKSTGSSLKVSFGKRRLGKAEKRPNKHTPKSKKYRGQGRC